MWGSKAQCNKTILTFFIELIKIIKQQRDPVAIAGLLQIELVQVLCVDDVGHSEVVVKDGSHAQLDYFVVRALIRLKYGYLVARYTII